MPLSSAPSSSATWNFIRIDGMSPNFNPDGSAAYQQRTMFASGLYPFAMTAFAVTPSTQSKAKKLLTDALTTGMMDSTLSDLWGVAYLDGATDDPSAPKQSSVHRYQGNNCSPLIN